jgi:tRNA 2-thiouridine synthesizing protein A
LDEPVIIDVRGLKCPLPVLKAAKRMERLAAGARCIVIATDPMAAIDIPHFCSEKGHRLVRRSESGGELSFEIEKGEIKKR